MDSFESTTWGGQELPAKPKKSGKKWALLALVGGCLLLPLMLVGVVVGLGALYVLTAEEMEPDAADWDATLNIDDVAWWHGEFEPELEFESLVKRRYSDDSWELEYTYEHPEEDDEGLYVYASIDLEPSEADARSTYGMYTTLEGFAPLLAGEDAVAFEQRDDLYSWGDSSSSVLMTYEGEPTGHTVIARRGRAVLYVVVAGVWTDEPEDLVELFDPALERMAAWRPAKP